jgi:CheY-like chemotaxis protein
MKTIAKANSLNSPKAFGLPGDNPLPASLAQHEEEGESVSQPGGNRTFQILVVDDEPGVCKAFKFLLRLEGHAIQTANSGQAALAALATQSFGLVITDYSMSDMKGDQLARTIKGRWPELPIIMATGSTDEVNAYEQPPKGVDQVISKPFSRAELREAMARVRRVG